MTLVDTDYKFIWADIGSFLLLLLLLLLLLSLLACLSSYHEKATKRCTSSLRSCRPSVYHTKMGEFRYVPFPTAQQVSLSACSPHCPLNAERQAGKL